jgi:uncharacterized protein YndB with AHSA1/START domain
MNDPTPVAAADEQILITPIFDTPREHVFKAWTDQDGLAAWYGPERLDTPREKIHIDLRVGGRWELTMVQRDGGREMPIGYEILELVEPELLVLRSDPMPQAGLAMHLAGQGPPGGCTGAREAALMQRVTSLDRDEDCAPRADCQRSSARSMFANSRCRDAYCASNSSSGMSVV